MSTNDTVRKTWDKEEYRQKARERDLKHRKRKPEPDIPDEYLTAVNARDRGLGLETEVNQTVVISAKDEGSKGFRCAACGVSYTDNLSYLDHLNSIQHLRTLGLSARIKRSTVEEVKARLIARKNRPKELDPKERIKERMQKEEERKRLEKEARRKEKEDAHRMFMDEDINKVMGFGGFSSSKKD
jgi:U4/U6.U5 tri-snRNP component SNU23